MMKYKRYAWVPAYVVCFYISLAQAYISIFLIRHDEFMLSVLNAIPVGVWFGTTLLAAVIGDSEDKDYLGMLIAKDEVEDV